MATLLWTPSNSHSLNLNLNGKQSLKLNANPSLHFNRRFRRFNTAISCNSTNHNDADTKPQSQSQAIQLYSQIERTFGCVIDVRIPCQHERMFGFVTFVYPETVKTILEEGNPHYVRGSRVLVKPYKERSKLVDRKNQYRFEQHHVRYSPQYADFNAEITFSGVERFIQRRNIVPLQLDNNNFGGNSIPDSYVNMSKLVKLLVTTSARQSQDAWGSADWTEVEGSWILKPKSSKPNFVVHFVGGIFVGAAPQLTYRWFLERLAEKGVLVIATPYASGFDHFFIEDEVQFKFDWCYRTLQETVKELPIFGVGHSLGSLVHLLIGSRYAVQRSGNVLMAFNNKVRFGSDFDSDLVLAKVIISI
ncbi:hypothetical protein KIW84_075104 [Lathyrus oleraceus]|uniref:RRM domain-containing protein n=1 Tax=Pisum sativum TaxID=3888 RepID=A0A9D4ZYZ7_PEA|nr:hypothetical protein KIW84_075104 [Pisum sativum]